MKYMYTEGIGIAETDDPKGFDTPEQAVLDFYLSELKKYNKKIIGYQKSIESCEEHLDKLHKKYGYLKESHPEYFI